MRSQAAALVAQSWAAGAQSRAVEVQSRASAGPAALVRRLLQWACWDPVRPALAAVAGLCCLHCLQAAKNQLCLGAVVACTQQACLRCTSGTCHVTGRTRQRCSAPGRGQPTSTHLIVQAQAELLAGREAGHRSPCLAAFHRSRAAAAAAAAVAAAAVHHSAAQAAGLTV